MPASEYFDLCQRLTEDAIPFVSVTLTKREGSVPQDVGSKMLVTSLGRHWGTVGGGRVEARAIEHAQAMLRDQSPPELVKWNLTTDIHMTCGGRIELFFECFDHATWPIVIFGAGHIAQALTRLLLTLPCQVTCIDPRETWLAKLPDGIDSIRGECSADLIGQLHPNSFVISMTQGHSHDLPVLLEIWKQKKPFPFVGVIGSKSKAGALRRELCEAGVPDGELPFHCPIGLPLGKNHPGEIAVSIAAQLLQVRDQ